MLRRLCKKNTSLNEEDICILERIEKCIPYISNLVRADIFIDCLIKDSDIAIAVAQAKPSNHVSLYKTSTVGELVYRQNEPAVLRTLELGIGTVDLKAITQENIVVKQNTVPIKSNVDKIIGVLIMEQDITEDVSKNRNMEILSETTEQLTESLMNLKNHDLPSTIDFNLINDAIVIFDQYGNCIYLNRNAEILYKKLGYKDQILGMKFENLVLNKISFYEILKQGKSTLCETRVSSFSLQVKYAVTKSSSNVYGVVMLIKDVTDIREKEKQLILKAVAIREIHHRVKNNLQTIASILRLQSRRINNKEAKQAFSESIGRILSIASTHEVLSQNGIDDVDIKAILSKIRDNFLKNLYQEGKGIDIVLAGDSFSVNSDKATSIAIVINELLENSVKHAFAECSKGLIKITIKTGIMYSNISITDNGKGFDMNQVKVNSLGLNIVKSIIKDKLNGDINIESGKNGTKAVFSFEN
ncbi:sensor histidine kinase [Clostridium luticellarii]|jgi:two-component sensor histidine kinase|uniref:histidine kinase n=1 Tax=Clostridium luticellarii TaxID=1691940 RepID=A0A2T0BNK3_9CLOT|nr:histidine kinase N-terminal domain-containing protein [Clostridium luticellarii]PRR85468.1 putative sensor histidine kinase pdtaS [Clostridium luticellarii]